MSVTNAGFQIKRLASDEWVLFENLIRVFSNVFEIENSQTTGDAYLQTLLRQPGFLAFVITNREEVIGGLTAYVLPMYQGTCSEIYIYDIAVEKNFQRKGLGKQLLAALQSYCKQNGIKKMFVQANQEDAHALEFYHATGGKAENVVHFTYTL